MAEPITTQINLADRDTIRTQLPQALEIYEAKRKQLNELQREVEHLHAVVEHLAALAGQPSPFPPPERREAKRGGSRGPGPAQAEVIEIVKKRGRPMRAPEVAKQLGKNRNPVGAALWAAAKAGYLVKLGTGVYAPPGYVPPADENLLAPQDGADVEADKE